MVKHSPLFLVFENNISYSDAQKFNAVFDMKESYKNVIDVFQRAEYDRTYGRNK